MVHGLTWAFKPTRRAFSLAKVMSKESSKSPSIKNRFKEPITLVSDSLRARTRPFTAKAHRHLIAAMAAFNRRAAGPEEENNEVFRLVPTTATTLLHSASAVMAISNCLLAITYETSRDGVTGGVYQGQQ